MGLNPAGDLGVKLNEGPVDGPQVGGVLVP